MEKSDTLISSGVVAIQLSEDFPAFLLPPELLEHQKVGARNGEQVGRKVDIKPGS